MTLNNRVPSAADSIFIDAVLVWGVAVAGRMDAWHSDHKFGRDPYVMRLLKFLQSLVPFMSVTLKVSVRKMSV
jgi:hypothetical protein